jgi:hypothetical protein
MDRAFDGLGSSLVIFASAADSEELVYVQPPGRQPQLTGGD